MLLSLSIAANALILFFLLPLLVRAGYGQGDARLEKLYASYISPCCWRENLSVHQSPEADRLRARIAGMVREGWSDQQIKQALVGEYGKRILSLPEGGVNLWLFGTPVTVLAAGAVGLVWLLRRMRRAAARAADGGPSAAG